MLVAGAVVGCVPPASDGSSSDAATASESAATNGQAESSAVPSTPASATPPPIAESPLKRRDVPPGGIAAQLGFIIPFDRCLITDSPGPPEPGPDQAAEAQVAHRFCISFVGFDAAQETIELVVTAPDGSELSRGPISIVPGQLDFRPTPAHQKGTYGYVASQPPPAGQTDPLVATGTFSLVAASAPAAVTMTSPGPPGTAVQIGIGGFPAGTPVPAFLYVASQEANGWMYLTELVPPVTVDAAGEGVLTIQTAPDDPPGRYAISLGSPDSGTFCRTCATFELTP